MTITDSTGNGLTSVRCNFTIQLPESGTTINVVGFVDPQDGITDPVNISPTSYTGPTCPPGVTTFYMIEVNLTTSVGTLNTSTSAMPVVDPGNIIIFSDTLLTTDTNLAKDPGQSVDTW